MMKFTPIERIIRDIKKGKLVIILDDEDRENEGDLIMAAQFATPEKINFMALHGRGIVCTPMSAERLRELNIRAMVGESHDTFKTAWTVSIDAKKGVSTGISARDRARTVKLLADPKAAPEDFVKPGHVFPLQARDGGVLVRSGHTEACVDMVKLAGLQPVGVICEIMNSDGTMARTPQLMKFAKKHNLSIGTTQDLIHYRRKTEKLVYPAAKTRITNQYGDFKLIAYESTVDKALQLAMVMGEPGKKRAPLVRVHSECLTGDVFGSMRCDCGNQLHAALKKISAAGCGVLLYMRQEGRGIGLVNKLKAYELQDSGMDTVEANLELGFQPDLRQYGVGAQILSDLGLKNIRLLTNNPKKVVGLRGHDLKIVGRVPIESKPNRYNRFYLDTKRRKMGHRIALDGCCSSLSGCGMAPGKKKS